MRICIIQEKSEKRRFVEKLDYAFMEGIVGRSNYEEIFDKIDRYAIFLGVYEAEDMVGYAALYANDAENKIAYISMIGVLDNMQGKHIGSELINKCIIEATKRGMNSIRLECMNDNKNAISFYEHMGFCYERDCSENSKYYVKRIKECVE